MISNWELFWALFTMIPFVVFVVAETIALKTNKPTYSKAIQRWLGVNPRNNRKRVLWIAFAAILTSLNIWFVPHILWNVW